MKEPIQEGQTITGYDEDLNGTFIDNRGVTVAIPGALKGEVIRCQIEHSSPHHARAWGRCTALLQSSPDRIQAPCEVSWPTRGACTGCPLMHISAPHQASLKKNLVLQALHSAGLTYIRDIVFREAPETLRYRNRTDLVCAEMRGKIVLGSYMPRSHTVIPTKVCAILRLPLNQVIRRILKAANSLHIPAYSTYRRPCGGLRYVSLFANSNARVIVDLVCQSADGGKPPWLDNFAAQIADFSAVEGVTWSINDSPNNAIRTAPSQLLCGKSRIEERYGTVSSLLTASGFTQLNTDVASQIYQTASDWLTMRPRIAWDLYCGAGSFGRVIAPTEALYGAEFNAPAIEAAREAAKNDPFKTVFAVLDLEKSWPTTWPMPDVILLDPPRKGLSASVLAHLNQMRSPIVYMSCNPASFARDVAALGKSYVIDCIEAFDMMPQTRQIEVLGFLRHK